MGHTIPTHQHESRQFYSTEETCRFSFAGMKAQIYDIVRLSGLSPGEILPEVYIFPHTTSLPRECFNVFCLDLQEELADICAGLQGLLLKHLAERIQRGCEYLDWEDRLPSHLVVSGGVASNLAVREGLAGLAKHFNMEAVFPPPRLCTDNGVMIAWAGLEALKVNEVGVAPENVLGVEVCVTQMFKYFLFFTSG